ncbi:MAG: paraquat-inducible protein A [Luteolibacter sp.]
MRRKLSILSWPKPPGGPHRSICHFCDTIHEASPIPEGTSARCQRCGAVLFQNRPASLRRATAFSMTALALLILVHFFPFLTMDAAGMRRTLNLTSASIALINQGSYLVGFGVGLFTVVLPTLMASGLLVVCGPLIFGRMVPGADTVAKWLSRIEPWNMIEVFVLAVLVSLLKIAKVADVHFGIGFYVFCLLMFCMAAAVAGIDRDELWDRLEVARGKV